MYQQLDGVAICSPLGPSLVNIFLEKMTTVGAVYYCRYVDDCFAAFKTRGKRAEFHLNQLYPVTTS